mgnify:CR=1 FL=1
MALNINGRMKVKTLRADFKKEFGLSMRVYDGKNFADEDATLASIRKGDNVGGEFSPARNTKVGNLEDKIMEMFGIKTQISGSDDAYLCNNDLTLAGALEEDAKVLARKAKKAAKNEVEDSTKSGSNDESAERVSHYGKYVYIGIGKKDADESFSWSEKPSCLIVMIDSENQEFFYWMPCGQAPMKVAKESIDGTCDYDIYEGFAQYFLDKHNGFFDEGTTSEFVNNFITCTIEEDGTDMKELQSRELVFLDDDQPDTDEYDGKIFVELHIVEDIEFETDNTGLYIDGDKTDMPMDSYDHYEGRIFGVLLD